MLGMSRVISGVPSPTKVSAITLTGDTGQIWDDADIVTITLTFDAVVTVTGTPQIELDLNGTAQQCTYDSGTGTAELVFTYTVQSSDNAPAGTFDFNRWIDMAGGSLQTSGVDINPNLLHEAFNTAGYAVSATPILTNVAFAYSNLRVQGSGNGAQSYIQTGDIVYVDVTYNKPITVTGAPYITLNFGATTRTCSYSSGTGTSTIRFAYTTVGADTSYDAVDTPIPNAVFYRSTAIVLNAGTLKDANALDASTDLSAYSAGGVDCNIPSIGSAAGGGLYAGRYGNHLICSTVTHPIHDNSTATINIAAETTGGYTDWRLPSQNTSAEIKHLLSNSVELGGFTAGVYYWTGIYVTSTGKWWAYNSTTLNGLQYSPGAFLYFKAVRVHGA